MPRLSVIVPYIGNELALERTILAVLQHRSPSIEVVVVHPGNYSDPYDLGDDEIVLVSGPTTTGQTELVNIGLHSATAPLVQVILPGTIVEEAWYDEPLELLRNRSVAAVAAPIHLAQADEIAVGVRNSSLPKSQIACQNHRDYNVSPLINGGVFRADLLDSLGGLLEQVSIGSAELDIALVLRAMQADVECCHSVSLSAETVYPISRDAGYSEGHSMGRIACGHASVSDAAVKLDSLSVRMGRLAAGLLNPISIAHRLGWTLGVQDSSLSRTISGRVASAREYWSEWSHESQRVDRGSTRRAA